MPDSASPVPSAAPTTRSAVSRHTLWLLAALTLVWGTNWPLFPIAVREISIWTFRAFAVAASGLVLLGYARLAGQSLVIPRRHWPRLALATISYLLIWNLASTYAAVTIPSGQSAVLGFTMPLWAALISWLILGEKLEGRMIVALLLGAVAVAALVVPNLGRYADAPSGLAAGLFAGLCWAVGTLILKRGRIDVPAAVLTGWQLVAIAVPLTIGALIFGDHEWFMPSWTTIAVVGYITLVPMAIGNLLWFTIVGLLPTNLAGLSSIMVPVVAMLSGALVHREPLGPLQLLAMASIAAALSLALLRPGKR